MKVLNLYAGVGGNRKLWTGCDVTAVEYTQNIADVYQSLNPADTVVVDDAHQYLLENHQNFDFIWSSPPCQSHTKMVKATRHKSQQRRYPNMALYAEIIYLQHFFSGRWVVENVEPYYGPLVPDGVVHTVVGRHHFWSNFGFIARDIPRPSGFINLSNVAGSQKMKDWLGIQYEGNLYYEGNHCPAQVLRNAVHPEIGLQIFNAAKQCPTCKNTGQVCCGGKEGYFECCQSPVDCECGGQP
jgi:DNA (cytosine-5)-methyltransferase 1